MTPVYLRILPRFLLSKIKQSPERLTILNNISWLVFGKIMRGALGLLVSIWLTRYLGPIQYGLFIYAVTIVTLASAIPELGLTSIVVRDLVRAPESASTTLGSAFVLQLATGVITAILINAAIIWLRPNDQITILIVAILSANLIFRSTDVIRYWFESQVQSRYIVWTENTVLLIMVGARILLILNHADLVAFTCLSLVEGMAIAGALLATYHWRGENFRLWRSTLNRCKSLLSDSWPLLLAGLSVTIYMRIDVLMLEQLSGPREVGIYTAATNISELTNFIPMVIVSSLTPAILKYHQSSPNEYLSKLCRLYFVLVWLALGLSLSMSIFATPIVTLLYGYDFLAAAPVLAIHAWAAAAVFLGVASSQHLLANGWLKVSLYRTGIGMTCNVLLNLWLIPRMGASGAAIATVVSYFVATFSLALFKETRLHTLDLMLSPFNRRFTK